MQLVTRTNESDLLDNIRCYNIWNYTELRRWAMPSILMSDNLSMKPRPIDLVRCVYEPVTSFSPSSHTPSTSVQHNRTSPSSRRRLLTTPQHISLTFIIERALNLVQLEGRCHESHRFGQTHVFAFITHCNSSAATCATNQQNQLMSVPGDSRDLFV